MKRQTKVILTHTYTKRCTYGNVYHAVEIENVKNGDSFTVHAPSLGNVEGILRDAFGGWGEAGIRVFEKCTDSTRTSSLPAETAQGLNPCRFEDGEPYKGSWNNELNKIGFRLPKKTA